MLVIYYLLAALLGSLLLFTLLFGLAILFSGNENTKFDTILMVVTAVVGLLSALAFRWVLVTILTMPDIKIEIDNYTFYATIAGAISYTVLFVTNRISPKSKFYYLMAVVTMLSISAFGVARVISFYLG